MNTLFDKIWDAHVVEVVNDGPTQLYIDRLFAHEVTSPQAFDTLRDKGIGAFRADHVVAMPDHNTPSDQQLKIDDPIGCKQVETLSKNCAEFGIKHFAMGTKDNGIIHVVGPEKALSLPGMTIVCGDSHTSTHGAVGAIAMGTNRYYLYTETIALGNSYYAQIPTELVVRDADDTAMQLTELFANVKDNKDLSNTILCLEDKFTLAISETYNDYTIYINDIGWNLAIAYLKDGDRKDALKTLELLIAYSESKIVIEKGKKLIEEIKQL